MYNMYGTEFLFWDETVMAVLVDPTVANTSNGELILH